MVKITILGSCRHGPYSILAKPDPLDPRYTVERHDFFNNEEQYQLATEVFYPSIEDSDVVLVYAPDGIGEHTQRGLDHAIKKKISYVLFPDDRDNSVLYQGLGMDLSVLRFEFDLASLTRANKALKGTVYDYERLKIGLDREIKALKSPLRGVYVELRNWRRGKKMENTMADINKIIDGVSWL